MARFCNKFILVAVAASVVCILLLTGAPAILSTTQTVNTDGEVCKDPPLTPLPPDTNQACEDAAIQDAIDRCQSLTRAADFACRADPNGYACSNLRDMAKTECSPEEQRNSVIKACYPDYWQSLLCYRQELIIHYSCMQNKPPPPWLNEECQPIPAPETESPFPFR